MTRLVQDMSETCTRPSMPSSISTKAPKLVRFRTLPLSRVPGGYLVSSVTHGSGSICFRPSEIFSFSLSTLSTMASIEVADVHDLGRMAHVAGPRHLGDVDQPFDALLELDEGAVVGDRDHLPLDPRRRPGTSPRPLPTDRAGAASGRARCARFSGSKLSTFTLTRSPIFTTSEGCETRPHDMSVMCEQAVDAAEVDEGAEVGDVLDHALADLVLLELLQELATSCFSRSSSRTARRETTMFRRRLLSLMILKRSVWPKQSVHVLHLAKRDLAIRAGTPRRRRGRPRRRP